MICPTCKGAKRLTVPVTEIGPQGRKESSFQMDCDVCEGTGQISAAKARMIEREHALWCRCGNPSEGVTYHEDNQRGAAIRKHHWTCDDCKKIVQIG